MRRPSIRCAARLGLLALAAAIGSAVSAPAARAQARRSIATVSDRSASAFRLDPLHSAFAQAQLRHPRVLKARIDSRFGIKKLYRDRGLPYPAAEILIRVFKRERVLELWARPRETNRFLLLKSYPICALAGAVGPKRRLGDGQTPEGFYEIDAFNPSSQYLLSLHVNYPNAVDRVLSERRAPGGAIYIHGGCRTLGCIAVTDDAIEELYWIAVEARAVGQERIPVHIFPARLTDEELDRLAGAFRNRPDLVAFWKNLQPGYEHFERTRSLPIITTDGRGRYVLSGPGTRRRADGEDAVQHR
ncbi:MAG: L,D-transpeptidase family protein [Gemmatimonadota bacterium]